MLNIQDNENEDHAKRKSLFREIEMPTDDEIRQKIRSLDPYQREVVNTAIKYARQIVKSRKPPNRYPNGPLINVSGGAGAGIFGSVKEPKESQSVRHKSAVSEHSESTQRALREHSESNQ